MDATRENTFFFDIETAPCAELYDDLTELQQHVFLKICEKRWLKENPEAKVEDLFFEKAALIPEFGKIVCISLGINVDDEPKIISLYNTSGNNDKTILTKFAGYLNKQFKNFTLCGYNINSFDIPYIIKHMIVNKVDIPKLLQVFDKKPWERKVIDIFDLWKGNRSDYMPTLQQVAMFLDCDDPKEGIIGPEVGEYFYGLHDNISMTDAAPIIKEYCEGDVRVTMQIFDKMKEVGAI